MSEKKNIERLFQEKFKDFEAVPEPKVWDNIEAALKEKKKRRVIPLWMRLSGAVAILLIGFLVGDGMIRNSSDENNAVVNKGSSSNKNQEGNGTEKQVFDTNAKEAVANSESGKSSDENVANSEANSLEGTNAEGNAIAGGETSSEENNGNSKAKSNSKKTIVSGAGISKNNAVASHSKRNNLKGEKNNSVKKPAEVVLPKENIASNFGQEKQPENTTNTFKNEKISIEKETKNINTSSIAFDTEAFEKQKKDSAVVAAVEPNALEELLKEKEKEPVTDAKLNRWQITSNVAPIYFSAASNGSPIDAQFADNSKSYESSMSYGVGVNYALSQKWSVKGGVNKLTLGYNTNDVVYYASLNPTARGENNSGYSAKGSPIVVEDYSAVNTLSLNSIQEKTPGHISQTMGFIEVPVEVSYKLVDRKFGIEIVGGMSTMFLNENNLSVVSNGMQATMGKADNLNDVSFTSNIGLGFKYKFWKSFEANVEPKFKYQLNTFSDDANGFKPYFIGIYSGINFSF